MVLYVLLNLKAQLKKFFWRFSF